MQNNFVDFSEGYGAASMAEVDELNKALEAGAGYSGAPTSLTGGGALQVESLDASLKSVTYEMKHMKMWPQLPKDQAYNTIEEYNRISAYGDQGRGFIAEGDLPRSEDSQYTRQIQRVRFIGVTRELTHVYTLVRNAHGDAMSREIKNGTMRILEIVERNLHDGKGFFSNAGKFDGQASINDGDLAWEGFDRQIRAGENDSSARAQAFTGYGLPDVVKDQRGALLDEDTLEEQARVILENLGMPSLVELSTQAHSDLSKQFYPKERINPMGVQNGKAGYVLQEFMTSAGALSLQSNIFIRPKRRPFSAVSGASAPSLSGASASSGTDSKFTADDVGSYSYKVTSITKDGESPESSAATATVAAGDKVEVSIDATSGAVSYAVYRQDPGASSHEFIGYVSPGSVGGAATFTDLNHKLPGLDQCYFFTMDSEVLRFKQLAPLLKMDLAIIATAYRWMQLLYGTPIVYTPRKCSIVENIGRGV